MNEDATATVEKAKARMTTLSKGKGSGNAVLQKAFLKQWLGGDWRQADKMMIQIRGLKEKLSSDKGMAIDYSAFNFPKLEEMVITSPQYSGILYTFWFDTESHTISFYRELSGHSGRLVKETNYTICFDPNFDEIYIPDKEFNFFYTWIVG
jgi:hypothetical protein